MATAVAIFTCRAYVLSDIQRAAAKSLSFGIMPRNNKLTSYLQQLADS